MKKAALCLSVVFLLLVVSSAHATLYSYKFDGVITRDNIGLSEVSVGDLWTATFVADTAVPDTLEGDWGGYHFESPLNLTIKSAADGSVLHEKQWNTFGMLVYFDVDDTGLDVNAGSGPEFQIMLRDWDGGALASDAIPTALDLSEFPNGRSVTYFFNYQYNPIVGEVTSVSVWNSSVGGPTNGVPEPATLLLLGLGVIGAAGVRRFRK